MSGLCHQVFQTQLITYLIFIKPIKITTDFHFTIIMPPSEHIHTRYYVFSEITMCISVRIWGIVQHTQYYLGHLFYIFSGVPRDTQGVEGQ